MSVFYLILILLSGVTLTTDLILRHTVNIKRFGLEKDFWQFKGNTVPIEDFVPHTLTMLLLFIFCFSISGAIYLAIGVFDVVSAIFGLCTAFLINFFAAHFVIPRYNKAKGKIVTELKTDDRAVCIERISGDGYGKIAIIKNGKSFEFSALSANETDIEAGAEVVVVDQNDGVYWVETPEEVFVSINEETTAHERIEPQAAFNVPNEDDYNE